jgi:hypothetical protein
MNGFCHSDPAGAGEESQVISGFACIVAGGNNQRCFAPLNMTGRFNLSGGF